MTTEQGQSRDLGLTEAPSGGGGCGGGDCGCGASTVTLPELDARQVPPRLRHATIFGALDSLQAGEGMVLVAPHDPLPLLDQVATRTPDRFRVEYLERGPEAWRLAFLHTGS